MHMTNGSHTRLVKSLAQLHRHDHPCLIYETRAEMIAVVAPFVKIGFERGERCLLFLPESNVIPLLDELNASGIDTADAQSKGKLYIPDIHEIYRRDEPFDPGRVLDFLAQAIADAKAAGHNGLRLIGDMPWTLEGTSGTELLIEYEARLNDFICSHDLPALCIYDRNIFPAEVLLDVLRTHPKAIVGNTISRSHSYLLPQEYFSPERTNAELNNLLRLMLPNEELIAVLKDRLELMDAVIENCPDFIYVKDLEGRYKMINPAGALLFGKPVEEMLGRTANEFMSADDAATVAESDRKALASDQPISIELTYTVSGVTRTYLVIKGAYRNVEGVTIGLFGISRDITERKWAERQAIVNQDHLRQLATQLSTVEEQERRRIAAALHDQIGQSLALANIQLGSLRDKEQGDAARKEIDKIRELLQEAIQQTRSLTLEWSPPCLYEFGLEAAVQSICEEYKNKYGIKISLKFNEQIKPMADDLRVLLYHGVRELLVNIIKHARSNKVDISFEKDNNFIVITVEDNGIGFNCSEIRQRTGKERGFGLFSLSERLKYYGGCFDIESNSGHGTRVTLVAPLVTEQKEMPGN